MLYFLFLLQSILVPYLHVTDPTKPASITWYSILFQTVDRIQKITSNLQNLLIHAKGVSVPRIHSPRSCAIHKQVSIEEVHPFNWFMFWQRVLHDVILARQCVQQHSLQTHKITVMSNTGIIYCKQCSLLYYHDSVFSN
jgi:hypothetical protein